MDIDDAVAEGADHYGGDDLHVAGEDDDIGGVLGELIEQPIEVSGLVGGGEVGEGEVSALGDGLEVGVVAQDADGFAAESAEVPIFDALVEAVLFFADEEGDAFSSALVVQGDADFHADVLAEVEQAGDELIEAEGEFGEVDEHVHDELAMDDLLVDIEDVDAVFGHVGGEAGDDAFLVSADDADDGLDLGHGWTPGVEGAIGRVAARLWPGV